MIKIKEINIEGNKIIVKYKARGFIRAFLSNEDFFVKYNTNINNCPKYLAVIPFLANIMPIVWLTGDKLTIDELDEDYYNSLKLLREEYKKQHPGYKFNGDIICKKLIKNNLTNKSKTNIVLFSGGVDACYTFIKHKNENLILATVIGADVKLDDKIGIERVVQDTKNVAIEFNKQYEIIISNFRQIVNEGILTRLVSKDNSTWWHDFQHGMALIGMVAPLCSACNIDLCYIASSYTAVYNSKCSSCPEFDNLNKFSNCHVVHDGYEAERIDKLEYINKNIGSHNICLRVCWESSGGTNCCKCEKCLRTIYSLWALGIDACKYGFDINYKYQYDHMHIFEQCNHSEDHVWFWKQAQTKANENIIMLNENPNIKKLIEFDFAYIEKEQINKNHYWKTKLRLYLSALKRNIKDIFKK